MCPRAKIVSFGSVLYDCYLDLDILDAWDILDVLLGCLCVDVIMDIWMFICGCYGRLDVYDIDSVKYD